MAPIPPYPKKDYNILSTLWICCQDDEWDKLRRLVTILCPHRIDYIMQYIPKTEGEKAWILKLPEPPRRHLSVGGSRFAGIPLSSQAFEHAKTNLSWLCRNHVDLDTLVTTYDLNPAFLIQACLELQLRLPPALSRELFWRYLAELLDHDYYNCIPLASVKSVVRYLDAYNPHMAFNPNDDPEGIAASLSALRQSARRQASSLSVSR
ncbi:hypothetical protein EWM64_g5930 [Hericium alpestre]|uniref:Uncharacterized protein n=1 Tax=Hericium alpestre TaxID=135208 RepID=A0A4Y9ZVK8_9AGAM|nr:hypothetical protein EWM64_g5930 [Hericium alpestre]